MKTPTMKTLTLTVAAALFTLSPLAQAHPELGPEITVVASPARVTANTYEREISAEAGRVPRVEARPADPRFAGYQEVNPKVGKVPPFTRNGDYFSDTRRDTRWFVRQAPSIRSMFSTR